MYENWINAILGLVIVGITFVDLSDTAQMWILGIIGAVIAANSFWGLIVESDTGRNVPR